MSNARFTLFKTPANAGAGPVAGRDIDCGRLSPVNQGTSIAELLKKGREQLESDTPLGDAEVLLSHALNKPRSYLHAHPEATPAARVVERFEAYLLRRRRGEPVAYITGRKEFWSLPFSVTPDTLIPRPETELLVETALELSDALPTALKAIDLGTGSGCIALALGHERPRWRLWATDVSAAALAVARRNAEVLSISNVTFVESDWFDAVEETAFDLVISNPPYVPAGDRHLERGDVRFEPRGALACGAEGLEAIGVLLEQALGRLAPGGFLLLEIGHDQSEAVTRLGRQAGYRDIRFYRDLAGIPRVFTAQRE